MKKFALALAVLLIFSLLIWWLGQEEPPAVTLANIDRGEVRATVANTRAGTVKACRRSKLSMPVGGKVEQLLVREGDLVAKGQLLLQLWNKDKTARVRQAQARVETAKIAQQQACLTAKFDRREANRLRTLVSRQLASEEAADAASTKAATSELACTAKAAEQQTAQSNLELQQAMLELTLLKAPFAGVIAEISGEIGEFVTPSPPGVATPPAVDLIDTSCLYVTAPIDEVDAAALRTGLPAEISLDAFGERIFQGELTRISPYVLDLEKQARTVDVDVRFTPEPDDIPLLVGYSADITIILESRADVLRVPTEAVIDSNQVLLYKDNSSELALRTFSPGLSNWNYTEVTAGLGTGDKVVLSLDSPGVEAGVRVRVNDDQAR